MSNLQKTATMAFRDRLFLVFTALAVALPGPSIFLQFSIGLFAGRFLDPVPQVLYGLSFLWLVAGEWWYEAFVVPWLVDVAPQILNVPPSGMLIAGAKIGFAIFTAGWVFSGAARFGARVFPHRASIMLTAGGVLGFLAGYPSFLLLFAQGLGWMGYWQKKHGDDIQ